MKNRLNSNRRKGHFFEIFGYDVIFDADLNCWLLEVNSSPSMGVEHLLDEQVKIPMVNDAIEIVDPTAYDRERFYQVLQRRSQAQSHRAGNPQQQLNIDLCAILGTDSAKVEKKLGNFEQIAPGEGWDHVNKLKSMVFRLEY